MLLFSKDEPGAPARVLRDFMKQHKQVKAKAFAVDGEAHDESKLRLWRACPHCMKH